MVYTEYKLREERQKILPDCNDERPTKKMKSIKHSKTNEQVDLMGSQLVDVAEAFGQNVTELLAEWGNGIPSIKFILQLGRRHQDKQNSATQLDAKKKKAEGNTPEELTINMIQLDAARTDLLNDKVMRLGKERLAVRLKITEMLTQKFWKELPVFVPSAARNLMLTACQCFPQLSNIA